MRITPEWLSKKFNEFNRKYFGGHLTEPRLTVEPLNGYWGKLEYDADYNRITRKIGKVYKQPVIKINGKYDRNAKDFANTLLHEMIHLYIYEIAKVYPLMQHNNKWFNNFANKLNSLGWNISESNEVQATDVLINNPKPIRNRQQSIQQGGNNQTQQRPRKVNVSTVVRMLDNMIATNQFNNDTLIAIDLLKDALAKEQQINEDKIKKIIRESINSVIKNKLKK